MTTQSKRRRPYRRIKQYPVRLSFTTTEAEADALFARADLEGVAVAQLLRGMLADWLVKQQRKHQRRGKS